MPSRAEEISLLPEMTEITGLKKNSNPLTEPSKTKRNRFVCTITTHVTGLV